MKPVITLQEHGGRTRSILSIEIGRPNKRATNVRTENKEHALKLITDWFEREVKKHEHKN